MKTFLNYYIVRSKTNDTDKTCYEFKKWRKKVGSKAELGVVCMNEYVEFWTRDEEEAFLLQLCW